VTLVTCNNCHCELFDAVYLMLLVSLEECEWFELGISGVIVVGSIPRQK
jgi:hypothetical protein